MDKPVPVPMSRASTPIPVAPYVSTDQLKYLAKVAEWIESAPDGTTQYGEFYVQRIPVYYDTDLIGEFIDEGGFWLFSFGKSS